MFKKNNSGFTLFETLIYIALLSIIIGASLGITYQIIDGTGRDSNRTSVDTEAAFVIRKIDFALNGVSASNVSVASNKLKIVPPSGQSYCFSFAGGGILQYNNGTCTGAFASTTSGNVTVTSAVFQKGGSFATTTFAMNGKTFQTVKYFYVP